MKIIDSLYNYEKNQESTINLIASENTISSDARIAFISDSISRYTFDDNIELFFPGRDILSEIEKKCCNMIGQLVNAKYVNVKPISGLNCMLALIGSLTAKDDLLYSLAPENGGHGATKPLVNRLGLEHKFLSFNESTWDIDYCQLEKELQQGKKVKMIYLDFMNILFPIDIKKLRSIAAKGTIIVFDASHVMGLIFGKAFQNPLEEGADFLIGSTHKSLPGPHKGIIASNKAIYMKILEHFSSIFISHHHTGDVVALGIVLEELMEYIDEYAQQVVTNAKRLGDKLSQGGIKVQFRDRDFTNTHQLWIDAGSKEDVLAFTRRLADAGIIVNALNIPSLNSSLGIRIGVQEVTYRGYKEDEIDLLAKLILDIYYSKSSLAELKNSVKLLKSKQSNIYCNDDPQNIIKFLTQK